MNANDLFLLWHNPSKIRYKIYKISTKTFQRELHSAVAKLITNGLPVVTLLS